MNHQGRPYRLRKLETTSNEDAFYEDWETTGQEDLDQIHKRIQKLDALNDQLERWQRNVREINRMCQSCK
jgi:hypothetical protein